MVQVWYPADKNEHLPGAPYATGTDFSGITGLVHLPSWFFDHLGYVTTHAHASVPAAGGKPRFPVLIFSTGRGGYRGSSTFEIEELVSHGYIVAGIDHPYTSSGVIFPDGRDVKLDRRVASSVVDEHIVDDAFMLSVFDVLGRTRCSPSTNSARSTRPTPPGC